MFPNQNISVKDVTQAYIQVHDLQRDVNVKPADQFNLLKDTYLKLLKPLYAYQNQGIHGSINTKNS